MARKTMAAFDVKSAEFSALAEYQYEVAMETLDKQDTETQALIQKVYGVLKQHSTGSKLAVTEDEVDKALFAVAMEVVKDMALLGIRLGEFVFPDNQCAKCGEEV